MKFGHVILAISILTAVAAFAQVSEDVSSHGSIDWSNQVVQATGISVQGGAGGRAGQIRAAELDALRQILETVKGIRLSSETTVEDYMLANDRMKTKIEGVARNFHRIGDPVYQSDGSIELTVEMNLRGPGMMYDTILPLSSPAAPLYAPSPGSGVYTGLIVDARGLGVRPALSAKVVDPQGREVYGSRYVDRDWAVKNGMVEYARDPAQARANDRVGTNPLVIKALRSSGPNRTDAVISDDNARLLHAAEKHLTFLQQARVVFLVD